MSKVLTVAWREFKQTVMRKIFIFAIIGIPLAIIGIMAIAVLIIVQHEEPPLVGTVAIVDATGDVSAAAEVEFDEETIRREEAKAVKAAQEQIREQMGSSGGMPMTTPGAAPPSFARGEVRVKIEQHETDDAETIDGLKDRVRSRDLLAAAVVPSAVIDLPESDDDERPRFTLYVAEKMDSDHVNLIERRIGQSVVRVRAARAGLDPDQAVAMLQRPDADTKRTLKTGEEASENRGLREIRQMIPMVFMMLIWIGTFTSGQHLMMSTIEEKSNRVMEVLLSAVSPLQLMTGKIFGHGGVGLLIVTIYSSLGVAALVIFATFTRFVAWIDLFYLGVFYIMAYFMIAALMAAVGSAVTDVREANTLMTPVMLILFIPLMLWMPIIQAPNGPVAVACSFIPPAIPFAMILRLAAEEPVPLWQIPLSIVWGYVCVVAMIWFAAKIFRVGVLMTGKPPSPLELLKWVRRS